jgi:hypothetical protein
MCLGQEAIRMEGLSVKLELALKTANEDALEPISIRCHVHLSNFKSGHNNPAHSLIANYASHR